MVSSRRNVLTASVAGAASLVAGNCSADAQQLSPDTMRFDNFNSIIGDKLRSMPELKLNELLLANGVTDAEELALIYSKRFPGLKAEDVLKKQPRLKDLIDLVGERVGEPIYEKGPTHDKEPYDKVTGPGGHDRIGFSRT